MISCTGLLRLVAAGSIVLALLPTRAVVAATTQEPPEVCLDKSGQVKKGEIDVVVLMDNSGSLEAKRGTPSDPNRLRFSALEEFLDNYAGLSSEGKNFGLISFSDSAEVVVQIRPISPQVTDDIKQRIQAGLERPDGNTDYVAAFKLATELLSRRPEPNCKILIWFTDGEFNTFSPNEKDQVDNIKTDLEVLEAAFCSEDGFATRVKASDINTFVVFLDSGISGSSSTNLRIDASIDVMQVITGDQFPSVEQGGQRTVSLQSCSDVLTSDSRHLGEVVSASEAGELLGYLTDLANIADGGRQAIEGDCPIDSQVVESVPMPSGYFIDWISITTWDGSNAAGSVDDLSVTIGSREESIDQHFESLAINSESNVVRFSVRPGSQGDLQPGWILRAADVGRVCIRVKPLDVKFRLSGGQLLPISPALPSALYDGLVSLLREGESISVSEAIADSAGDVTGSLRVENGEVFNADGTLPISLEISDLPVLAIDRCRLELIGTREGGRERLESTTCVIYPSPTMTVTLDADSILRRLDSCDVGVWHTTVDGVRSTVVNSGVEPVSIGLATESAPDNRDGDCNLELGQLVLRVDSATVSSNELPRVDVLVELAIVKRASALIASILAFVLTLIVSVLSLLLLRLVNDRMSKTVRAQDFFGYETDIDLALSGSGRGEVRIGSQAPRTFEASIDDLQTISTNRQQTDLRFGSVKLNRQLPQLFRPFGESRLVLDSGKDAVFWKPNRMKDGLPMAFPSALILVALESRPPTVERPVRCRLSVIVPKRGAVSGVDGVQKLVRERAEELANDLVNKLTSRAPEGGSESEERGASASLSGKVVSESRAVDGGGPPERKPQSPPSNTTPTSTTTPGAPGNGKPPEPPGRNI